jgi:2-oxoglutarate dehydrogenase E1 component
VAQSSQKAQQYAHRGNLEYIEQQYTQYKANPSSVSSDWQNFFEGVEFASEIGVTSGLSEKELDVYQLINAYRNYGHFEADLDPLTNSIAPSDQLQLGKFNLSDKDLDTKFAIGKIIGKENASLREIIQHLKSTYCGKLTVQCAEALPEVRNWFIREFETNPTGFKLSADQKKRIYDNLAKTEALEKFLHTRYVGAKRFSIEGGDALIPMLDRLVLRSSALGIEEVALGMAHRGRVNVLFNFLGKDPRHLFAEFNGPTELEMPLDDFDGDVKYHLGYKTHLESELGKSVEVTLAFNPSHLEAVNPVVLGMTRAAQRRRNDTAERKKVVPVLIHGDAAFAGQGVVLETFQMSQVRGYRVGGTIHIAIDNQVGFTTSPENARSSHYCSDVAKILHAPVLHVNGDDVESCVRAMEIAARYRQEWGRDIVINMVCYRRFGHNEGDEPGYTQPLMYEIIKKHPTLREIYGKSLVRDQVLTQSSYESIYTEKMDALQKLYDEVKVSPPKAKVFKFEGAWKGLRKSKPEDFNSITDTKVSADILKKVGKALTELPAGFNLHPKLLKLVEARKAMSEGKEPLDWGTAEMMAYGSLLAEGTSVRLTGQDCVRGTFAHRHSGFYDIKTGEAYFGLDHISPNTEFCVYDSILSEYGVMGFEYGNSISDPSFLTIWEAQFGDFANGAQIIIDQFLASGESKWQQMSGLVLLLPHGYEGQGPEHSSARLERFLQLCAQYNMTVANLTTPAQIFHALRRQVRRPFRKPLIVMSPKSLLRHPRAVSPLSDLSQGTFQEVIPETLLKDSKSVETVVFCSGKIYYELLEEREKQNNTKTALVRIEQIYPTPAGQITEVLKSYPKAKNIVWAQEEPKNMGAWAHLAPRLESLIEGCGSKAKLSYVGRPERASTATGTTYRHKVEQSEIIQSVFKV